MRLACFVYFISLHIRYFQRELSRSITLFLILGGLVINWIDVRKLRAALLKLLNYYMACDLTSVKMGGVGRGGPNGGTSSLAVTDTCQSNKRLWSCVLHSEC